MIFLLKFKTNLIYFLNFLVQVIEQVVWTFNVILDVNYFKKYYHYQ